MLSPHLPCALQALSHSHVACVSKSMRGTVCGTVFVFGSPLSYRAKTHRKNLSSGNREIRIFCCVASAYLSTFFLRAQACWGCLPYNDRWHIALRGSSFRRRTPPPPSSPINVSRCPSVPRACPLRRERPSLSLTHLTTASASQPLSPASQPLTPASASEPSQPASFWPLLQPRQLLQPASEGPQAGGPVSLNQTAVRESGKKREKRERGERDREKRREQRRKWERRGGEGDEPSCPGHLQYVRHQQVWRPSL